jgi:hypothetical protein
MKRIYFRVGFSAIKEKITENGITTEILDPSPETSSSLVIQFFLKTFYEIFFEKEPAIEEAPLADRATWDELRRRAFVGLLSNPADEALRAEYRRRVEDFQDYVKTHYVPQEWKAEI